MAFLSAWLSDKLLSPHHRQFLNEEPFESTLRAFLAEVKKADLNKEEVSKIQVFLE
jgi:hypothetical protein